jgi:hypothetical protein
MNERQKKNLRHALRQIRQITGRSTDDEGQTIFREDIYCFRKRGKAWDLIDVEEVKTDKELATKQRGPKIKRLARSNAL